MFDEINGEPVKEFRVDRTLALQSEVFGGLHESLAEEHLPEVVHGHASGEGVVLGGQPVGEA